MSEQLLLTPKEAQAALGIKARKLWEMTNLREIPYIRVGRLLRYPRADLEAWIEAKKVPVRAGALK